MEAVGGVNPGRERLEVAPRHLDRRAAALAHHRHDGCAGALVGSRAMTEVGVLDDAGPLERVHGAVEGGGIERGEQREQLVDRDAAVDVEEVAHHVTARVRDPAPLRTEAGECFGLVARWFFGFEAGSGQSGAFRVGAA